MNPNDSDEMLMLSYGEGDLQAFGELYRRHSRGLYQFIAWRAPRRDWVEEIVQDSWAALHEARARYRPEAAFRTWLYQIARNRLIDLLRQKQLKLASEMGAGVAEDEGSEDRFGALVDGQYQSNSPEAELEQKQQVSALHQAIGSLPSEQKEALVLQQFNGLSIEEIAEITQVAPETVKSRLRYAMQKLRSRLQERALQGETA
jgi:RNA polymerase sigma-70 factor (ECF subfamily)